MDYIGRSELAQFINNNLNVQFMAITVSAEEPFGIFLKHYTKKCTYLAQKFKEQLYDELNGKTKEQLYSIEININDKYLTLINAYLTWFNENKKLTEKHFPIHNPYALIYKELSYVKKEILLYFPNKEPKHEAPKPIFDKLKESKIGSKYDLNNWDDLGFKLFGYLNENYQKKGKIKYINIWYFLKSLHKKGKIIFNLTQKKYNEFLTKNHSISITRFTKSKKIYDTTEKPILESLTSNFLQSLS